MTLLELTLDAASKVDTYKNPDIADWADAIDPVLIALGAGSIGSDTVEDITVGETYVHITTSYSVRGCDDRNTIQVPIAILEAGNPVHSAKIYRIDDRIAKTNGAIAASRKAIAYAEESLAALYAEKFALESPEVS